MSSAAVPAAPRTSSTPSSRSSRLPIVLLFASIGITSVAALYALYQRDKRQAKLKFTSSTRKQQTTATATASTQPASATSSSLSTRHSSPLKPKPAEARTATLSIPEDFADRVKTYCLNFQQTGKWTEEMEETLSIIRSLPQAVTVDSLSSVDSKLLSLLQHSVQLWRLYHDYQVILPQQQAEIASNITTRTEMLKRAIEAEEKSRVELAKALQLLETVFQEKSDEEGQRAILELCIELSQRVHDAARTIKFYRIMAARAFSTTSTDSDRLHTLLMAPVVGAWEDMYNVGEKIRELRDDKGLGFLHDQMMEAMQAGAPHPDVFTLWQAQVEKKSNNSLKNDVKATAIKWENFYVSSCEMKIEAIENSDAERDREIKEVMSSQPHLFSGRTKTFPKNSMGLLRQGCCCITVSPAEIPIPLTGSMSDDELAVDGFLALQEYGVHQRHKMKLRVQQIVNEGAELVWVGEFEEWISKFKSAYEAGDLQQYTRAKIEMTVHRIK